MEGSAYKRIGIYGIRNTINDKIYIGKTGMNFGDRWDSHKSLLKNGKHENQHLQRAWDKYGADAFEFIIVEECSVEDLDVKEKHWIKYYKERGLSYNILDGGDGFNNLGTHLSEETKRKIGEKNRINGLGRKASEETRRKMSESHKGYKPTPDAIAKTAEASRKAMQANPPLAKLTPNDVREIRRLNDDGVKSKELAEQFGVSYQCIRDIILGKRWSHVI
jgi:group I intron endonuclease